LIKKMSCYVEIYYSKNINDIEKISLVDFIEKNSDEVRKKYINIIDLISNKDLNGKKFFELFQINHTTNVWWLSTIYEKSFYKSKNIFELYKIIAVDIILKSKRPIRIKLNKNDFYSLNVLKQLCDNHSVLIDFTSQNDFKKNESITLKGKIKNYLPDFVLSIIFLIFFYFKNFHLRKVKKTEWLNDNSITLVSYFGHINLLHNYYKSVQWMDLPSLISSKKMTINWLHYGAFKPRKKNDKTIFKLLRSANKSNTEKHNFLENYNSILISFEILKQYFQVRAKFKKISLPAKFFNIDLIKVDLWPLLKDDWNTSFLGIDLMHNLIIDKLIKSAVDDLNNSKLIIYPMENQGWERSLLMNVKNKNIKKVGYIHSTLRYWDTRYLESFGDFLSYSPKPDYIALHSSNDIKDLKKLHYPANKLIMVEALRYMDALNITKTDKKLSIERDVIRVLLLGDFQYKLNYKLLNMLDKIYNKEDPIHFTFKCHPSFPLDIKEDIGINIDFENRPIKEIIHKYNTVVAIDASGSAVDALLLGSNLLVFTDNDNINYSPLRKIPNIIFINNSRDLKFHLSNSKTINTIDEFSNYYYNDINLSKWRNLIS